MRNQAVALTKMDLSLVVLGEQAMDTFDRLLEHNFMRRKIKMTEPARRKHNDLQVLLQYLILRHRPETGFSGTEIMSFCDDLKNGEPELPVDELSTLLDYLDAALPEKRQYLKKVHIPVVLYVARNAMEMGMAPDSFRLRLDEFFWRLEERQDYMDTYRSGSAKRSNVQPRVRILSEILDGYDAETESMARAEAEAADVDVGAATDVANGNADDTDADSDKADVTVEAHDNTKGRASESDGNVSQKTVSGTNTPKPKAGKSKSKRKPRNK
jgi:hypothetical protein